MAASHWLQIPPSLPKKSKMWPCPDPPWTDLKIEGFYNESLLLICTSPLEEGSGTVEGQRAPCREAGEAQWGPERPRTPRELREPKKYWFYLHFCWAKSGPGLPIHPRLQKSFPTSDFRDAQKKCEEFMHSMPWADRTSIFSQKIATICPKGFEEIIFKMMNLGRGGPSAGPRNLGINSLRPKCCST